MSTSFDLYLDSDDSISSNPANAQFFLGLGPALHNHTAMSISVESFVFPNLEFSINSKNNLITFQENNTTTDISLSLTPGFYDGDGLAVELQTRLNAAGANTYTVTYSDASGKLTVTVTSGTNVRFMNYSKVTGFLPGSFAASLTSDFPVRLDGSQNVYITSNLSSTNYTSKGLKNVLKCIPLFARPQEVLYYTNSNDADESMVSGGNLNNLEIRLLDDNGQILELPANAHWSLALRVTIF
jgi:hypothetical protein